MRPPRVVAKCVTWPSERNIAPAHPYRRAWCRSTPIRSAGATFMPERKIRYLGDPILKTPAAPVTRFGKSLQALIDDLMDTVAVPGRAGLAAPQIGVGLRAFSYNVDGRTGYVLNPELVEVSDEKQEGEEGCLSVPGLYFPTPRARSPTVRGVPARRGAPSGVGPPRGAGPPGRGAPSRGASRGAAPRPRPPRGGGRPPPRRAPPGVPKPRGAAGGPGAAGRRAPHHRRGSRA